MAVPPSRRGLGSSTKEHTSGLETPMDEMPIPAFPVPYPEPMEANTRAAVAPANPSAGAHGGQSSNGLNSNLVGVILEGSPTPAKRNGASPPS